MINIIVDEYAIHLLTPLRTSVTPKGYIRESKVIPYIKSSIRWGHGESIAMGSALNTWQMPQTVH